MGKPVGVENPVDTRPGGGKLLPDGPEFLAQKTSIVSLVLTKPHSMVVRIGCNSHDGF